jgi:tetratricopeptide (TPR) repeat protein
VDAALALSPTYWYAFKERGLIYYEQSQLPDAIIATERAVELRAQSPANVAPDWRDYWSMRRMLAYWLKNLGRAEECLKNCRALLKAWGPEDSQVLPCSVWIMHNTGQYAEIMASLREIHKDKNIRRDASELVLAISALAVTNDSGIFDKMVFRAAWTVGREELTWIKTVYESALKRAITLRRTVLRVELELRLAKQLEQRLDQPERAAELWEGIMARHRNARYGTQLYTASRAVLRDLFNAYTNIALSNKEDAEMVQRCLEKVQVMAGGSPKYLNDGNDEISLELGILHRLLGRDEEAANCFRTFIKFGVEFLTDDDEGNDWDGYVSLINGVTHAGPSHAMDRLASFSLLGVSEKEKDLAEHAMWKLWYASCDGCGKQLYTPDDTWACVSVKSQCSCLNQGAVSLENFAADTFMITTAVVSGYGLLQRVWAKGAVRVVGLCGVFSEP